MKVFSPLKVCLSSRGVLATRDTQAIFVRKHNLEENLHAVQDETSHITESNAHEWLFLVEGYRKYKCVENRYLDGLIDKLNINADNPIQNPFTSDVAEAASVDKLLGALSVLVMDYLDFIEQNQAELMEKSSLEALFNQGLQTVAEIFEVSPKALKREFNKLKWRNEGLLAKQLLLLSSKRKNLIAESNSQSKKKLAEILGRNAHPNLFVMAGIEHKPVFEL